MLNAGSPLAGLRCPSLRPAIVLGLALTAACGGASTTAPSTTLTTTSSTTTTTTTTSSLALTSTAWVDGGTLPAKAICKTKTGLTTETNPPLEWSAPPSGTAAPR
mgnify:CR=1 FL=1